MILNKKKTALVTVHAYEFLIFCLRSPCIMCRNRFRKSNLKNKREIKVETEQSFNIKQNFVTSSLELARWKWNASERERGKINRTFNNDANFYAQICSDCNLMMENFSRERIE